MVEAAAEKVVSPRLLSAWQSLTGEQAASLPPAVEKAVSALVDDEYERLSRDERRAFWNDVVRRELKRAGVPAGALAMSALGTVELPTDVALSQLEKQGAPVAEAVARALARLRTVVVDCVACETLTLARFKAEDDRCRTCGGLFPVAPGFGSHEDAARAAALVAEELGGEAPLALELEPAGPVLWDVVKPVPDLSRLLVLSKENEDWDAVLEARARAEADKAAAEQRARDEAARVAAEKAAAEKRTRDEAARVAAEKAAAERRAIEDAKRAADEAKRAAGEAKRAADEAKRAAEEAAAAALRRKAEEEAARRAAEAELLRKAEEAARLAAEKAAAEKAAAEEAAAAVVRRKAEEEAAQKAVEAELLRKAGEAAAAKKAAEDEAERRRRLEETRLAIGGLAGANAGKITRIDDLDPKLKPSGKRPLVVMTGGKAKILVPSGTTAFVNDKVVSGAISELVAGDIVRGVFEDDDLSVIDENGELAGVNAEPIHFKRADQEVGGPWNYWNEPIRIGGAPGCEIYVGDRGVDELHATIATRFGRVVVEDACKEEDGLWIAGTRVRAFVARPGTTFQLGSKGPSLVAVEGQVEVKAPADARSPAMKPARYVRTVLHVQSAGGEKEKIFLFARREVRFGRLFSKGDKVENDLVIAPADDIQTIANKQGSFSLTRDGVTVRLDDRTIPMHVNDEELKPGQTVPLKRRFTIEIGTGCVLNGEVHRSPTSVLRSAGPGQLGVEGGHPYECVRMVREDSSRHTYVFLVRQIRLGSGETDSIKLPGKLVGPGHAMLQLSRGVLQLVAPREQHKVKVDGHSVKPGEAFPLKLGSKILLGDTLIRFEVASEQDFAIEEAPEAAASS